MSWKIGPCLGFRRNFVGWSNAAGAKPTNRPSGGFAALTPPYAAIAKGSQNGLSTRAQLFPRKSGPPSVRCGCRLSVGQPRSAEPCQEVVMYTQLGLYIDGEWLNGDGRAGEDVINPANGEVLGRL